MLFLQNISYSHPNKDLLFENVHLSVSNHNKIALIGHNGVGKSTLLKIVAKELLPSNGQLKIDVEPYYVPQIFDQYNHLTIAKVLQIEDKLRAMQEILIGHVTEENYALLGNDWTIEDRCQAALNYWELSDVDLAQKMESLSGGQKTRVFLAGISIHAPKLALLDEPSNHLDLSGRQQLYSFIQSTSTALLVVSHDRKLLNLLNTVCELSKQGLIVYGGNYDFYVKQKQIENNALNQDIHSKENALRKAKEREREALERKQRLDARGKKKQSKSGMPKVMMNKMKNDSENSSSKLKGIHTEKISIISQELQELRSELPDLDKMKFGFDNSGLHRGKILFTASGVNFSYDVQQLWPESLNFQIKSGERIALKGLNGSGKTTLIKLILGSLKPKTGTINRVENQSVYIDQDYSLINNELKVYEQAEQFNISALQEHEIKTRLNRFLFTKEDWDKPCDILSGGERMRLMLCCLTISRQSPDMVVLDEPTNNLDIQNIEILTSAINEYQGTLIVVSHDDSFLEQTNIERTIELKML
ncbi:ATPase components of ABC transporters with duplicated ATPase domains [Reichenbachiella faecimaris]|uniref:ATPase components of ABC transporters with duplicated ATPase domains n=1 Tax=Reichenbachiella faecimaris TaxID=692418 RepID=A0A1W2GDE9_REIFA|nr:ABC-F family ATP-binding cassette domain-containing protein [Reichenbachiella faecimaris]SMD34675.1 ATPase components of ABC transporters with duplicated ATPase domains [Reichenbachiella faecimaris]